MTPAHKNLGDVTEELRNRVATNYPALAMARLDDLERGAQEEIENRGANFAKRNAERTRMNDLAARIRAMLADKERYPVWTDGNQKEIETLQKRHAKHVAALAAMADPAETELPEEEKRRARTLELANGILQGDSYAEWIARQNVLSTWRESRAELPKGDKKAALESTVAAINEKLDRLWFLQFAPVTADESVAAMREQISTKASFGRFDVTGVLYYRSRDVSGVKRLGEIMYPEEPLVGKDINAATTELGVSALCWIFQDEIAARLERDIRARLKTQQTISIADRTAEESRVKSDILQLQRVQVRLCDELELPLPQVHPLALFEIERGDDRAAPPPWNHKELTAGTNAQEFGVPNTTKGWTGVPNK